KPMLGDIEPVAGAQVERFWTRPVAGAQVEAISLTVEDGIAVPFLLIRPAGRQAAPVVVATAQEGKERFLANRAKEIEALVRSGIAVCLPDVRATRETAPTVDPRATSVHPVNRLPRWIGPMVGRIKGSRKWSSISRGTCSVHGSKTCALS